MFSRSSCQFRPLDRIREQSFKMILCCEADQKFVALPHLHTGPGNEIPATNPKTFLNAVACKERHCLLFNLTAPVASRVDWAGQTSDSGRCIASIRSPGRLCE